MDKFYPIVVGLIPPEEGGGFVGYAPDLLGCMGDSIILRKLLPIPKTLFLNGSKKRRKKIAPFRNRDHTAIKLKRTETSFSRSSRIRMKPSKAYLRNSKKPLRLLMV